VERLLSRAAATASMSELELVGFLDQVVDDGTMGRIDLRQSGVRCFGFSFSPLCSRQQLVSDLPELPHLGVGLLDQHRLQGRSEDQMGPERLPILIVLLELVSFFS